MAANATAPADLFPIAEAAQRLRIATSTLREWCLSGKISYLRLGRQIMLTREDLQEFLRSSRVSASK
jgi:excisionase family DNA binding protein